MSGKKESGARFLEGVNQKGGEGRARERFFFLWPVAEREEGREREILFSFCVKGVGLPVVFPERRWREEKRGQADCGEE